MDRNLLVLEKNHLKRLLPHGGLAVKIDGVVHDSNNPNTITAWRVLDPCDLEFNGHFTNRPIYPGVCTIELGNLAAAALIKILYPDLKGNTIVAKNGEAGYKQQSIPGDILFITVSLVKKKLGMFFFGEVVITNQRDEIVTTVSYIKGTSSD